jgi:hypothetical protein
MPNTGLVNEEHRTQLEKLQDFMKSNMPTGQQWLTSDLIRKTLASSAYHQKVHKV